MRFGRAHSASDFWFWYLKRLGTEDELEMEKNLDFDPIKLIS